MKKKIIQMICLITLLACKPDKANQPTTSVPTIVAEEPKALAVRINYSVDKKDIIQCVFNKIELDNNQEGNFIVTEELNPSSGNHELNFTMFDDYIALLLQLRLGKEPKSVTIENILLEYGEKQITVNGSDLDKYFALNQFIDYNPSTSTLKTIKKKEKHSPTMTLRQVVLKELFDLND